LIISEAKELEEIAKRRRRMGVNYSVKFTTCGDQASISVKLLLKLSARNLQKR